MGRRVTGVQPSRASKRKKARRAPAQIAPDAPKFAMTAARVKAAQLVACDEHNNAEIAQECGVNRKTLTNWKAEPVFRAKVAEFAAVIENLVYSRGVANRARRVRALNDRWEHLQRIIAERAADPNMEGVPGGKTGLLVHQLKSIGHGENARMVDEYVLDTGLLKELRDHERQAAQELGQLVVKVAPTSPDGTKEHSADKAIFTDEEKGAIIAAIVARLGLVAVVPGSKGSTLAPEPALAGFIVDNAGAGGPIPAADDGAELLDDADDRPL